MTLYTKWIKTGNIHDFVFLGKEVIATASGNHVIFYNLVTKEENIEYFNNAKRGEGVCCLAGHSDIPIFSTVERRYQPKIYIHTYPRIKKVAECKLEKNPSSYISCSFVGSEYLLSLTSYPNFRLIIWRWKTGENIASIDTLLTDELQSIEASLNSSNLLYQFAPKSGKLSTYEIHTYSKKATIIKNCIQSIENKIVCVCWTNNRNLLLCDVFQNVFIVSSDGKKIQMIICKNQNIDAETRIFVLSINDRILTLNNDLQLTYYNKSFLENNLKETWNVLWFVKLTFQIVKMTLTRHKDAILLHSKSGKIFEISLIERYNSELKEILNNYQKFKLICLLNSEKKYGIVVDSLNYLIVINLFDGSINANFQINKGDEVIDLSTHPSIPLLSVITSSGKCICFIVTVEHFTILKMIHLQRQSLHKTKFSTNGNSLGVSSKESNNIFLLETVINKEIKIILYIHVQNFILDFLIFDHGKTLQLLILVNTCLNAYISNCIEIYSVIKSESSIYKNYKIYTNTYYKNLHYGLENGDYFIGLPYLLNQIHFFKFENNKESISLFNIIHSEHKLKKFDMQVSKNFILTSGFDGFIILRANSGLLKILTNFMVHHYQEKGTKCSVTSICGKVIVCLGKNGSIVGVQFCELEEKGMNEKIKTLKWKCKDNSKFYICGNQTWLEQKQLKITQIEKSKSLSLKQMILFNIKLLKEKIKSLMDSNESKSLEFQLPISMFDFNRVERERKIHFSICQRKETNIVLRKQMRSIEKIISYIIQNFLNMYEIPDCTLASFNNKTYVNNFSIRHTDKFEEINDIFIDLFDTPISNTNIKIIDNNEFLSNFELLLTINKSVHCLNDALLSKYNDDIIFSGSTSCKWLKGDISPNQLLKLNFNNKKDALSTSRENKLKIHFNEKFEKIKNLKNHLLQETSNRLKKLNKYKNELKNLFGITVDDDNNFNNIWQLSVEFLENINVEKDTSYTLETNIYLNNKSEETFKGSNSDHSFQKEKLKEMMDGHLEIRWKDKISNDASKPYCLLFKTPSKYDKEDLKAIVAYKQKITKLEFERLKYKAHVQSEIKNINGQIKTDIGNFDEKMEELAMEKIKIRSAILQEFLLRLNEKKSQFLNNYRNNKEILLINKNLLILENEYKTLINEIANIELIIIDLKSNYENVQKRNKILEVKFREEFSDLKKPMVEYLIKHFKRKPEIDKIMYTSLTCLVEMNKYLISGRKSEILPQEYLNFQCNMNAMDVMPNRLPQQIDNARWKLLCRLRRNKVELEIKLKIAAIELADAQQASFYLQKISLSMQSKIFSIKNAVQENKLKKSRSTNNFEVQLVLKAVQIEIHMTGYSNDFKNATFVTYKQLTEINNRIVKEGEEKMTTMRALIALKKTIIFKNWKYQCALKKIKYLKQYQVVLQSTKVRKEIQTYLIERLEKKLRYKHSDSCEIMLQSVEKKFQRMLKEKKNNLLKLIAEEKYWRKMNAKLITKIEFLSLKKLEESLYIEKDYLQKRNKTFKNNYLRSIMERTRLGENIKESCNQRFNLQTQLELLKWKTYPILCVKKSSYFKKSSYLNRSH